MSTKCVKVTGAQNTGQGHWVKIPAKSVHLGEALCKVWWLEVLHLRRSGTLTRLCQSHCSQNIGQGHQVSAESVH